MLFVQKLYALKEAVLALIDQAVDIQPVYSHQSIFIHTKMCSVDTYL